MFSRAKNILLDLLFPTRCAGCRIEGSFLCQNCIMHLQWLPPRCIACGQWTPPGIKIPPGRTCISCRARSHIYGFFSPCSFSTEPIRQLIHALKYQRARTTAPTLAAILEHYIQKFSIAFPANTIIIPIPLHKSRERVRGFNQSTLLAEHLAQKLNMSMKKNLLVRTKKTRSQIELSGKERKENMQNVFMVSPNGVATLHNKTILLVDDVKTTGATLEEAARVLKESGARRVWAATIAH